MKSRQCKDCGETDPSNFYPRIWVRCKRCFNIQSIARMNANRAYAVQRLGGKCSRCPFKEIVALDIHHTDPTLKDVNFRTMRGWSRPRIDAEISTCILLCKNDHALEHERLRCQNGAKSGI